MKPVETTLRDLFLDSLGNPTQQAGDWGTPSEAHPVTYLVVPGPGAAGVLAIGGLAAVRRRRR